jgi:membrane protease YdiL (CAAX protease family)
MTIQQSKGEISWKASYGWTWIVAQGLTAGNWVGQVFRNEGGKIGLFYALYSCSVGPFAEEVAERGFLYRAFRENYGIYLSIALIICLDVFFHWQMASHSFFSLGLISSITILTCIIREKTGSTWNCIFFHVVYNAITQRQWLICAIAILFFYLSHPKTKPSNNCL